MIDRSLSPEADEFQKLKAVMEAIVERDVGYNDLVWVIEIQSALKNVKFFEMPPRTIRCSDGIVAEDQMRTEKEDLQRTIGEMSQVSANTDIESSLNAALEILENNPRAFSRTLVLGSDMVSDLPQSKATLEPPRIRPGTNAEGVGVVVLVTAPKSRYLQALHMTISELLTNVKCQWGTYFRNQSASSVNTLWVDAVPVSVQAPLKDLARK